MCIRACVRLHLEHVCACVRYVCVYTVTYVCGQQYDAKLIRANWVDTKYSYCVKRGEVFYCRGDAWNLNALSHLIPVLENVIKLYYVFIRLYMFNDSSFTQRASIKYETRLTRQNRFFFLKINSDIIIILYFFYVYNAIAFIVLTKIVITYYAILLLKYVKYMYHIVQIIFVKLLKFT